PSLYGFVYGLSLFAALIVGTLALRAFQRRHAQQEARTLAEAAMYKRLSDAASDLITRHAIDGTVLYASPAAEEILGLLPREIQGLSPAMIVHIQDLKSVEAALARAVGGEPQIVSFRVRRRDGTYVPVEMRVQRGDAGDLIAVTRDMSAAQE